MTQYSFEHASLKDIDPVLLLIKKRIDWMDQEGIHQWNKTNYLEAYPKSYFEQTVKDKQLYVLKEKSSHLIVGAVVLSESDERWDDNAHSYYIHNLVSALDVPNVGQAIMRFSEIMAKEKGINRLRLDCQASNIELNNYYKKLGFTFIDTVTEGTYIGNKLEKKLNL